MTFKLRGAFMLFIARPAVTVAVVAFVDYFAAVRHLPVNGFGRERLANAICNCCCSRSVASSDGSAWVMVVSFRQ